MKKLSLCFGLLILAACSNQVAPNLKQEPNQTPDAVMQSQSFTYELIENGCSTGKHTFSSKEAYCQGLQSTKLNQGCAIRLRKDLYESKCSDEYGAFQELPESDEPLISSINPHSGDFVYQITGINFLTGGLESCELRNGKFVFNVQDQDVVHVLCKNSKVEVQAISNLGTVTFKAVLLEDQRELTSKTDSQIELGKSHGIRFYPENPYGFTYVIASDVTGIDSELLTQWNELNREMSSLKNQYLLNIRDGIESTPELEMKIAELKTKMDELEDRMKASKNP